MDFLGLSNLTTIKNALRIIKKVYGKEIDINNLPLDDKKTFKLFQEGNTTGVFQFESAGMKRYLKELKPTVFNDLVAMNALYRPGPMQWIEDYIARKHGERKIEYTHEAMKPALESTYGVIVFQEQVMQISKDMCGFTGGQADSLRKGIGKKIPAVLAKFKSEFIEGAIKTVGADRKQMEAFWKTLEAFASYAFPKAHSACYSLIAYQTAYLKAHYPSAFMAALMTSDFDDIDRLAIEITECKHMGIDVLPPDVNESFVEFAVVPKTDQIRFGMSAIKNVGIAAVEEILRAREEQTFDSLESFLSNVSTKAANRKTLESLIKAGAFDSFGERSVVLNNIDVMLAFSSRVHKQKTSGQTDLFGNEIDQEATKSKLLLDNGGPQLNQRDMLMWERELLGIYLSQHPLESFEKLLEEQAIPLSSLKPEHDGKAVSVGGAIMDIREITTKNGQKMAFIKMGDKTHEIELILFPSIYQQTLGIWERDRVVMVKGKINAKDREGNIGEEVKVMVDDAREITHEQAMAYESTGKKRPMPKPSKKVALAAKQAPKKTDETAAPKRIYIRLEHSEDQDMLMSLKSTIDSKKGDTEVVLVLGPNESKQIIKLPMRASEDQETLFSIGQLVGAANVKLH